MNELMLYSGPRTREDLRFLAWCGFKSVCYYKLYEREPEQWSDIVRWTKDAGLVPWVVFPDWPALGLCGAEDGFQTYDGDNSSWQGDDNCCGPSYWHPEADEIALEHLPTVVAMGFEGALISPRYGDTPYPAPWNHASKGVFTHCTRYWSWDPWARDAWAKTGSDMPMPRAASLGDAGLGDMQFYNDWYMRAPARRVSYLSEHVIRSGITKLATWYVPFTYYTGETLAMGTAGSMPSWVEWYERVTAGGQATALMVAACLFAHSPLVRSSVVWSGVGHAQANRWPWIAGIEADGDVATAEQNIQQHLAERATMGLDGFFVSDKHMGTSAQQDIYRLFRRGA